MTEVVLSIFTFILLFCGMAVGFIISGKPISGSCGGVGKVLGQPDYYCELCGGDAKKCESSIGDNKP